MACNSVPLSIPEYGRNINTLPDEMLMKIFSYLNIEDICFTVCLVCKQWNSVTKERLLWRCMRFVCDKSMSMEHIAHVLQHAQLLQSIQLQWRTDVEAIIENLCHSCGEVNNVDMVCCGKVKNYSLQMLVEKYPQLENLSLEKCWTVEDTCYNALHRFKNLRGVNISHSRYFNGEMLKELVDSCPFLVHINMDYIRGIMDGDLIYAIQTKKNNLVSLILFGEILTDISLYCLGECTRLETLHLTRCHLMTRSGLAGIAKLHNLRSLKLRFGLKLSSADLIDFLSSKSVSEVEYLCLSRSETFNDVAANVIAENCKRLRQLDAVYCPNFTELGRGHLLERCSWLRRLNFTDCNSSVNEVIVLD